MTQKAVAYQTNTDRMIKLNNDTRDLYALQRQAGSIKTFSTASAGGDSISPAGPGAGNFLPISGGTMIGAIGFNPALVQIDDGHINISRSTEQEADFASYILVTGQGSPDDLQWIDGAAFNGQYLVLQGTEEQIINLLHANDPGTDGNILTSDGETVVMDGTVSNNALVIVTLIFDVTVSGLGAWRVTAVSNGGGINTDFNCKILENVGGIRFCPFPNLIFSSEFELLHNVGPAAEHIFAVDGTPKWRVKPTVNESNNNINMKTFDLMEVDRIRFKFSSGGPVTSDDPSIYLTNLEGDTFVVEYNAGDIESQHSWKMNDIQFMKLLKDPDTGGTTTLILQSDSTDIGDSPHFLLTHKQPNAINHQVIGSINYLGTRIGNSLAKFYGWIDMRYENRDLNDYSGAMLFGTFRGGSSLEWLTYNLNDHGYISTHAHIHLNAKDLLFQVDEATGANAVGFKNLGPTVIGLSLGSEVWRFIPGLWRFASDMTVDMKNAVVDIDEFPGVPDIPIHGTRRMFVNGANDELSVRREDGQVVSLESQGSGGGGSGLPGDWFVTSVISDRGATPSSGWLNGRDGVSHILGDLILFNHANQPEDNGIWEVTGFLFGNALITLKRPDGWTDGTILNPKLQVYVDRGFIGEGAIFFLQNNVAETTVDQHPLFFGVRSIKSHVLINGIPDFNRSDSEQVLQWIWGAPENTQTGNSDPPWSDFYNVDGIHSQGNGGLAVFLEHTIPEKTITAEFPVESPPIFTHTFGQDELDEAYSLRPDGFNPRGCDFGGGYTWMMAFAGFAVSGVLKLQFRLNGKEIWDQEGNGVDIDNDPDSYNERVPRSGSLSNDNWGSIAYFDNDQVVWSFTGRNNNPPLRAGDKLEVFAWTTTTSGIITINDIVLWLGPIGYQYEGDIGGGYATFYAVLPPTVKERGYKIQKGGPAQERSFFHFPFVSSYPQSSDPLEGANFNGRGYNGAMAWLRGYSDSVDWESVKNFPLPFWNGIHGFYRQGSP